MEEPTLYVKMLFEDSIVPVYAHKGDAGADVFAHGYFPSNSMTEARFEIPENGIVVNPHDLLLIGTGCAYQVEEGHEVQVRSRSGLALRKIKVSNSPGTIDENYRGEVGVILENWSDEYFVVKKGMKIAQIVIKPVQQAKIHSILELNLTARNGAGFGSTGV